jgi:hypothetical protein
MRVGLLTREGCSAKRKGGLYCDEWGLSMDCDE